MKKSLLRSGFTMIELIFVIVILAVIAGVTIPKLMSNSDKTQISDNVSSDMRSIFSAVGEWKKTSGDSDGSFNNLTTTRLATYLPSSMGLHDDGDYKKQYIKSSGFSGNIHYFITADKKDSDGDRIKIYVDASAAAKAYSWDDRTKNYIEHKIYDTIKSFAINHSTDDGTFDATGLGDKNSDLDTGGNTNDAEVGVRRISF